MKKAYVYVIITAFLFATMEVSCKIGGASMDPFQLTYVRFLFGGLILLPFAIRHLRKESITLTLRDHGMLLLVGIFGVTISMSLFQLSVVSCNASTVSVLFCSNPFFTMLFAHFLSAEKINAKKVAVLLFALSGIVFMIRPWDIQSGNTAIGIIEMLLSALIFGFYTVEAKICQRRMGFLAQTSLSFIYGALVLMIVVMIIGRPVVEGIGDNLPVIFYTGIVVTGIGYFCYFKSIELSDAGTGSFAFFIKPAIAPFIAMAVLKETIMWNSIVGVILILTASAINVFYKGKNKHELKKQ